MVRLGDGGAEEGGDVVVALGDGLVEGRALASRDGGVGTARRGGAARWRGGLGRRRAEMAVS